MRLIFILILIYSQNIFALNDSASKSKNIFKLTLFDNTFISQPKLKVSIEKKITTHFSIEPEYGSILYSLDEDVIAHGNNIGFKLHNYNSKYKKYASWAFAINYSRTRINDYLLTTKYLPGLGTYNEYEKLKYFKNRFSLGIERVNKIIDSNKIGLEGFIGIYLGYFNTIVPEQVSQQSFRNGILTVANARFMSLNFGLKFLFLK